MLSEEEAVSSNARQPMIDVLHVNCSSSRQSIARPFALIPVTSASVAVL